MPTSSPHFLRFDDFTIDTVRCILLKGATELPLRRQSFAVLRYLADHRGEVVSSDQLIAAVWAVKPADHNSSVAQCIKEIRRALGDNGRWIVKTVSGRGYEFKAEIVQDPDQGARGIDALNDVSAIEPAPRRPVPLGNNEDFACAEGATAIELVSGRVDPILNPQAMQEVVEGGASSGVVGERKLQGVETVFGRLQLVSLPLLLLAAFLASLVLGVGMLQRAQPRVEVVSLDWQPSLLVLPFNNLSGDPEQEYFTDGITGDLIDGLSLFGAKVIARGTAFSYKGRSADARDIGRELGVRYVLEGTVRHSGEQIRVTGRLVEAATASTVWSEAFDIERRDLPGLRDDLVVRLARFFKLGIMQAEGARSLRERPSDPQAWDFLARAWWLWYRTPRNSDMGEIRHLYREALKRDETLKDAWIGLSYSYLRNVRFSPSRERDLVEAEAAAERAITLDGRSTFAHMAMGWVRYEQKRMYDAYAAFEWSIKLNASEPQAHAGLGAVNIMLARPEKALAPLRRAMALSPRDPLLWLWQLFMGAAHLHLGQDSEATDWLRKSVALNPTDRFSRLFLASALALSAQETEARREMAELLRLNPDFTLSRFRDLEVSNEPAFLAQRQRVYQGLRLAGVPE